MRFGPSPESIKTIRIAAGGADLILGCDMIVAGNSKTLAMTRRGTTHMLVNTQETMPGDFARNADMQYPSGGLRKNVADAVGPHFAEFIDAGRVATALMGDSIAANMFMLGYAYQRGLIPIGAESIDAAIVLNGSAQQMNRDSFMWGRRAAVDPQAVERLLAAKRTRTGSGVSPAPAKSLDETISLRKTYLTAYQNEAYGKRYTDLVARVRSVEQTAFPRQTALTEAIAKYYFKLLAIKDEYEVARLHVESGFLESVSQQFEGDYKLVFNLAPPLLAKHDPETGEPKKSEFGSWIVPAFRLLSKVRFLRGTPFDVFGYTTERRAERALIRRYEENVQAALSTLEVTRDSGHHRTAIALASVPEQIRGYGHVRAKTLAMAHQCEEELLASLQRRVISLRQAA
jgi:indolepyruvate ferredoxin oxidoreductase